MNVTRTITQYWLKDWRGARYATAVVLQSGDLRKVVRFSQKLNRETAERQTDCLMRIMEKRNENPG